MKYGKKYFAQLNREIFEEKYLKMSTDAKWLYCVLTGLEHKYTSGKAGGKDYFTRSDKQLSDDSRIAMRSLSRAKRELIDAGLIEVWQENWIIDEETGKKSTKHVTAYRLAHHRRGE